MEPGRTVGTDGCGQEVAVCVVVVQTAEPGLDFVSVAIGVTVNECGRGGQLDDTVHQTCLLCSQVGVAVVVVLVSCEDSDGVVSEGAVVSEQLVECVGEHPGVGLGQTSVGRGSVVVVHIIIGSAVGVAVVGVEVYSELQALCPAHVVAVRTQGDVGPDAGALVLGAHVVVVQGGNGVEVGLCRTRHTVVELTVAQLVESIGAVEVLKIYRVDGSHELC